MPTMPKEYSRVAKREQRARESILKTGLLPYQDAFMSAVTRRDNRPEIAALSVGRGNGKTHLCGEMLARALKPSDDPAVRLGVGIGTCHLPAVRWLNSHWKPHGWS